MIQKFDCGNTAKLHILNDLQGQPYKFYRGTGYKDISIGRFFCSCFDIAKDFRLFDNMPIIETEIAVKSPLVIDGTLEYGYCNYNNINVLECKLYPKEARNDLLSITNTHCHRTCLSTDEILKWAKRSDVFDAIIIKNLCEGINTNFPIYDVIIWDACNLRNTRDVTKNEDDFKTFQSNTYKRIDLSRYIAEAEVDGIVNTSNYGEYLIEHKMEKGPESWYLIHTLQVYTTTPIRIYCLDTQSYITASPLCPGHYLASFGVTKGIELTPYNGVIYVNNISPVCKFKIDRL